MLCMRLESHSLLAVPSFEDWFRLGYPFLPPSDFLGFIHHLDLFGSRIPAYLHPRVGLSLVQPALVIRGANPSIA